MLEGKVVPFEGWEVVELLCSVILTGVEVIFLMDSLLFIVEDSMISGFSSYSEPDVMLVILMDSFSFMVELSVLWLVISFRGMPSVADIVVLG